MVFVHVYLLTGREFNLLFASTTMLLYIYTHTKTVSFIHSDILKILLRFLYRLAITVSLFVFCGTAFEDNN